MFEGWGCWGCRFEGVMRAQQQANVKKGGCCQCAAAAAASSSRRRCSASCECWGVESVRFTVEGVRFRVLGFSFEGVKKAQRHAHTRYLLSVRCCSPSAWRCYCCRPRKTPPQQQQQQNHANTPSPSTQKRERESPPPAHSTHSSLACNPPTHSHPACLPRLLPPMLYHMCQHTLLPRPSCSTLNPEP